jgi:hypothetical protein
MSFRDTLGSKLREVREQAQLVVKNIKLPKSIPTFDDMAALDDYIHSEEYNVRGQPQEYKNSGRLLDRQQPTQSCHEQRQDVTIDNYLDETSSNVSSKSTGASPAWSLLDQTSTVTPGTIEHHKHTRNRVEESLAPTITMSNKTQPDSERGVQTEAVTRKPLFLSIYTDTLQDTPPMSKSITTSISTGSMTNVLMDRVKLRNNDDVSLDKNDDEINPNFPLKKDHTTTLHNTSLFIDNTTTSNHPELRKSSRRFMEDLERRLEQPENDALGGNLQVPTMSGMELEIDHQPSPSPAPYFSRGSFGGAVLDTAMRNVQRMIRSSDQSSGVNEITMSSVIPPLARERTPKPSTSLREEQFSFAASDSVLSQSELEVLTRQTKFSQSSMQSLVMKALYEHRNYLFIAFTLLLAVFVYFLTQKSLDDNVT